MAQKPNFLKKLTSGVLMGASTAALIAGVSSSAMGAATNYVVTGAAQFTTGANMGGVAVPGNSLTSLQYNSAAGTTVNVDVAGITIQAIDTDQGNAAQIAGLMTLNQNVTIGSISHTNANVNLLPIALNGKVLTLTGTAGTGPLAAIAKNTYDSLGQIDMAPAGSTLTFNLASPTTQKAPLILENATIANGAANGTLNVQSGFIQVSDKSFATVKTINIGDGQGFIFNTDATAGNALNLQVGGATINFNGADGTGRLVLLSKAGDATDFNVMTGSLGGNLKGIIEFNTVAVAGQLAANAGPANAVIGINNAAGRAAGFVVSVANGNAATVAGQVYAKDMVIQSTNAGGQVNFGHIVDVGTDGTTAFKTAASKVAITQNSNFGATDFGNLAVQITVPDTITLTGNFTGDASTPGNTAGVITFAANGTLASGNADANVAVTSNITAIEASAAGIVQLSGTHTAELRLGNANSVFKLADGTVINGKVNQTALVGGALAGGAIQLDGSATITGDIGNGGGAAPIQGITLANDASKTLTLGGANIIGANAGGTIDFQANGGTVKLTNTQNNILVDFDLAITTDKTGVVDASALTNNQTLTISGTIGTIAANNKTLGQLNVGSSKTALNGGDVAINELVIGNNGSVQLAHNTYLITKTTNAAGQGKMIFNPVVANNTTLADGTNLGSAANPLAEINFGAPTAPAVDTILNVGKGANLYATNITTAVANTGSFVFDAGGTNIVSGTVGGQQGNKFNTVALDNGTTAQFLGNAIFNGETTIEAASTLQIGGNYTTDNIASADNTGIVQFVNADNITVTLNKQAGAVDALAQITVSGPGNVVINEIGNAGNDHGVETDTIAFTEASLGAAIFLPSGIPFNDAGNTIPLTITSKVGNGPVNGRFVAPAVVVSGVDSTIANGQAIGDQNNIVGLGLASDNSITVNATTLYAGIASVNNNQGTVTLSGGVPNTPGTIYGLGIGNGTPKLKQVTFTTDYNNLGSIIATNAIIEDGLTVTTGGIAGKDFDGTITLGSVNGNSNVRFVDGTNSTSTSTVATVKANNGTVTYLGSASVGNIGAANTLVASVQFTGPAGSLEKLLGNIYSTTTNFGNVNLNVAGSKVILGGGTTAINGNINLVTNTLAFESGTSTWGGNTSLSTTLNIASDSSGVIGHIVIAEGAQVNATTTGTTTINVQDNANANFSGTQPYTLIQGGARFNGTLGAPNFVVIGSNRFVNYGLIRAANQDYVITRTNNAANVVTNDIANSPFGGAPGVGQNVTTFVNATNTAAYNNLLLAKNSADSANFVGSIVTDTSAAVTNAQLDVAKDIQAHLGNRVNAVRYLGTPETAEMAGPEAGAVAPVAAGDEAVDNVAYGIWAKPFYTDAHQSKKGGVAGYKAKTTGVVIGLDTLANDNLMIGAAIGITKTDIKHQDYKKGDKTDVNGFSFSLYGAQQLVENFFAQGSAIFSLNQVKNKSQRYFFDANGNMSKQIAAGNYDNMTFGGNLTVGYDYNAMEGVLVTPMAGLSYLKSSDENYKETGTTVANKQVNSKFSDRTDLIVGARVMGGTMNFSDLAVYPEAHAFVVHKVNGRLSKTQSQLDGQVTPFISQPDRTAKTSYNLGLSASIRPDAKMEYGIGYDAQIASKYTAHQGTLKVRVNF